MTRSKKKKKTGAKAVSGSCRNHGDCPWCKSNRTHKHKRMAKVIDKKEEAEEALKKIKEA